jgi:hypothetical protein
VFEKYGSLAKNGWLLYYKNAILFLYIKNNIIRKRGGVGHLYDLWLSQNSACWGIGKARKGG